MNSGKQEIPEIILASESPRRKEILTRLGIKFSVCSPSMAEINEHVCPSHIPVINACRKAENIAAVFPHSTVIGADTVIEFENRILGKPGSMPEAREMLMSLSGKKHFVVTSVCIRRLVGDVKCVFYDSTEVEFRKFSEPTVMEYLDKVYALDKAGAYAVQEYGKMLISGIKGSCDNVIGLPSEKLVKVLQSLAFCRVMTNLVPGLKLSS